MIRNCIDDLLDFRPLKITVDLNMLYKLAFRKLFFKLLNCYEIVMHAILISVPRLARCRLHAKLEFISVM